MDGERSFYRIARRYPPADEEYLSLQERKGDPPADASDEVKRSRSALSAFDSEAGARAMARKRPRLGTLIVRYDIPIGAAITWEKTLGPGHFDLRGEQRGAQAILGRRRRRLRIQSQNKVCMMNYELWDVAAGRGLGRYQDEDEALALVRTLLDRYGAAYTDDLELGIEDDDGTAVEMVTGSALAARSRATSPVASRS